MKIAFMGSDEIALPMLDTLIGEKPGGARVAAVFTQPDRKTGRGMRLQANAIKQWAERHGLPVYQPVKCGKDEAAFLKAEGFDLVLVMAYGQFLPSSILEATPLGALNLHASILPRLRGASPIHTAVALGHPESGVSFMRITPQMDAGPVADVEQVPVEQADTSPVLHAKLARACPPLIRRCLGALAEGPLEFKEQDPESVTYCRIIRKTDARLDFREPAENLYNRVRAFTPWPVTSFPFKDVEVRIIAASFTLEQHGQAPGTVLDPDGESLAIACGRGVLKATRLQRPGGKPLDADAFLRGFPIDSGEVIESREMAPLESRIPFPYRKKGKSGEANT